LGIWFGDWRDFLGDLRYVQDLPDEKEALAICYSYGSHGDLVV